MSWLRNPAKSFIELMIANLGNHGKPSSIPAACAEEVLTGGNRMRGFLHGSGVIWKEKGVGILAILCILWLSQCSIVASFKGWYLLLRVKPLILR